MNLKQDLHANEIADHIGYSVYHFCRVFSMVQGVPLMDFVRKKRLNQARRELLLGRKVIDIAFEYGFETASGFSKAFRKEFGYSPTVYIAKINNFSTTQSASSTGEFQMNPMIMRKPAFKVAGYGIRTNIASGYIKDIAAYWDTYIGENLENKMYTQLNPPAHGEVGICIPSSDDGNIIYLFGVIVEDYAKVTPDMMTWEVPEAQYAVFTTPPVDNMDSASSYDADPLSTAVKATWKYIFEEWFPSSDYAYDESKLDFEFYDERCHGLIGAVMDIYVPIK
ncbi:effector binding domain-containing protein [Paenibacillus terrigena]|uniref:AraC family transcriptional regulator n=1 Tax=Paenibacillus terrigena TaxID=369333 RepID=UPI0028D030F4|nr:helix-turn-helix domain-containing protein [Paenibacillus terrigena]